MSKATKVDAPATDWVLVGKWPYAEDWTGIEYFYDGQAEVVNGVIRIPVGRCDWAQRLLCMDYAWKNNKVPDDFVDAR